MKLTGRKVERKTPIYHNGNSLVVKKVSESYITCTIQIPMNTVSHGHSKYNGSPILTLIVTHLEQGQTGNGSEAVH